MMNKTMAIWLKTTTALTSILVVSMSINPAHANPKSGKVVEGDVKISQPNSSTVQVNQNSQKAIVDWRSFDIAPNETTRFVQPNSRAWILNRVNGSQNPTTIQGRLEANGNVAIVNPDGILFSQGASVDVNSLIATTHNISNDDFMAGRMNFHQPGNLAASVINEGTISIGDHGLGAFVAPGVRNSGVITARFGSVSLAAGNSFTLDLYGDGLVNLAIGDEITKEVIDIGTGKPMSDLVKNSGTIKADGGRVALKAATARRAVNAVINNTGIIEANTIGMEKGMIVLGAQTAASKSNNAPRQKVKVSGRLQTAALPTRITVPTPRPRSGGEIEITAEDIELSLATIDASGVNGGGTILIGGDYLGGNGDSAIIDKYNIPLANHDVPTAAYLTVDAGSKISADATDNGDGGKIVLWSDDTTSTAADITAKGGNLGGDGGFIETSGKQLLDVKKAADASAVDGAAGTWLLDPDNLTVTDDVSGSSDVSFGYRANSDSPHYMTANGTNSLLASSVIEAGLNNGTDVFLVTDGNIDIEADIEKTSGDNSTLTINAGDEISILSSDIVSTSSQLNLKLIANKINFEEYSYWLGFTKISFQTNGGYFDVETKGIDSSIDIKSARINTMGGNVNFYMIGSDTAIADPTLQFYDTSISTQGGDIRLVAIDSHIDTESDSTFDTGGGDLLMMTASDKYPIGWHITESSTIKTHGGNAEFLSNGGLLFRQSSIQTDSGLFAAASASPEYSMRFKAADILTNGGDVNLSSAGSMTFGGLIENNDTHYSNIDARNGNMALYSGDFVSLGYGTILSGDKIEITASQIDGRGVPYSLEEEVSGADFPLVSNSGIILTSNEFNIPVLGDPDASLVLNFKGDSAGKDQDSLIPVKGFSTIELNRSNIDAGSRSFRIFGTDGDDIRGIFEPDGVHFPTGYFIKTSRNVQIDVGDQTNSKSGLYFPSSENDEIFTTFDTTDGKIEFFGVNNVNGEAPLASSLSVGGTKNVWLNSVKYSTAMVPDPIPTTYTPKPVSGASLPTGVYVIGELIDIPLPILFSVDGGTIVSQTVFRPTDGNFQIITVNGQKRLVGTYNGNPGTINLTFEAISDTQKSAQLSLPITFTSANVVTPTPAVTPEPTPTVITSQKEEVQEEVTLVENPENRVKIPVRPIGKPVSITETTLPWQETILAEMRKKYSTALENIPNGFELTTGSRTSPGLNFRTYFNALRNWKSNFDAYKASKAFVIETANTMLANGQISRTDFDILEKEWDSLQQKMNSRIESANPNSGIRGGAQRFLENTIIGSENIVLNKDTLSAATKVAGVLSGMDTIAKSIPDSKKFKSFKERVGNSIQTAISIKNTISGSLDIASGDVDGLGVFSEIIKVGLEPQRSVASGVAVVENTEESRTIASKYGNAIGLVQGFEEFQFGLDNTLQGAFSNDSSKIKSGALELISALGKISKNTNQLLNGKTPEGAGLNARINEMSTVISDTSRALQGLVVALENAENLESRIPAINNAFNEIGQEADGAYITNTMLLDAASQRAQIVTQFAVLGGSIAKLAGIESTKYEALSESLDAITSNAAKAEKQIFSNTVFRDFNAANSVSNAYRDNIDDMQNFLDRVNSLDRVASN